MAFSSCVQGTSESMNQAQKIKTSLLLTYPMSPLLRSTLVHLLHPVEPHSVTAANGIESLWNQLKCHYYCWSSISLRKLPGKFWNQCTISDFGHPNLSQVTETLFFRRELNLSLVFLVSPWGTHSLQLMHQLSVKRMSSSAHFPLPSFHCSKCKPSDLIQVSVEPPALVSLWYFSMKTETFLLVLTHGIKCPRSGTLNVPFLVGVGGKDRCDDGQVPDHASCAQQLLFQHSDGPWCSHHSQWRSKTGLSGNAHVLTYFQKFSLAEFDSSETLNKECEPRAHQVNRVTSTLCKNVQAQE